MEHPEPRSSPPESRLPNAQVTWRVGMIIGGCLVLIAAALLIARKLAGELPFGVYVGGAAVVLVITLSALRSRRS